jgi:hypothetical protein
MNTLEHVDILGVAGTPDPLEEPTMREQLPRMLGQLEQQTPLGLGQMYLVPGSQDRVRVEVDLQVVGLEPLRRRAPGRPTQQGADPGHQLIGAERLGQAIVGGSSRRRT